MGKTGEFLKENRVEKGHKLIDVALRPTYCSIFMQQESSVSNLITRLIYAARIISLIYTGQIHPTIIHN